MSNITFVRRIDNPLMYIFKCSEGHIINMTGNDIQKGPPSCKTCESNKYRYNIKNGIVNIFGGLFDLYCNINSH